MKKSKELKPKEKELVEAAKQYLKKTYGEDTLAMKVTKNEVKTGDGVLSVECTVKGGILRAKSDWRKKFYFKKGKVVDMDAWQMK